MKIGLFYSGVTACPAGCLQEGFGLMRRESPRKGFTLAEVMIVVVVLSILAGIMIPQYQRVVERGRVAEAKNILGRIRAAEKAYYLEHDSYTTGAAAFSALGINVPIYGQGCEPDFYYSYKIDLDDATDTPSGVAVRCNIPSDPGGKPPDYSQMYTITLYDNGTMTSMRPELL